VVSEIKKVLGERLKAARERKNLKQNRVAHYLGIHNSTLAKYESGEREPDIETINKLARLYEVSVDYLMGRSEKETKVIEKSYELDQLDKEIVNIITKMPKDDKKHIVEFMKRFIKK